MRHWSSWLPCFCALVLFVQLASTAPADPSDIVAADARPTAADHGSAPKSTSESQSTTSTTASLASAAAAVVSGSDTSHRPSSTSHSLVIPPTPSTHHPGGVWSRTRTGTFTHPPLTPFPHGTPVNGGDGGGGGDGWHHQPPPVTPGADSFHRGGGRRGQSTAALAFEIIAGVAGVLIVASLGRCVYMYRRTPAHDRLGATLDRYHLQREMEELERERMEHSARALERYRWHPPPPPYQSAPAYDTVVQHPTQAGDTDCPIDWGSPPQFSLERARSPLAGVEGDRDRELEASRLSQPSPTHPP